jgi:S-formylglutathione hydrolase FrmB
LVGDQAAIVVTVAGQADDFDLDWRNGRWLWESVDIGRLIPYVDTHFRTIPDRAHRAIAGDSDGGWTAMHDAARHPDLFIVAGSFSGLVGLTLDSPLTETALFSEERYDDLCGGGQTTDGGLVGDPVTNDVWWHNADPLALAGNLGGLSLYLAAGKGTPCRSGDLVDQLDVAPVEPLSDQMSHAFDTALTRAGVKHTTDFYGCGLHTWRYFVRDLKLFWPIMLGAFGHPPPVSFDYRTADSAQHTVGLRANSVYGWTFTPDAARAPEFLDVHNASRHGVTLTGSGLTSVTTAPLFDPGQTVGITGAGGSPATVQADNTGRLSLKVDLGAPHTLQQYTLAERLAEHDPNYFHTRTISFITGSTTSLSRRFSHPSSRERHA